jgi:hypothetical protein
MRRIAPAAFLFLCLSAHFASAQSGASPAGDSSRPFGLLFDIQASPHVSSLSSWADGGYTISLGFGLNISPWLQAAVNVYTGREQTPGVRPVEGWLPVGGASLEATVFFSPRTGLRPYAALGYGLYTLAGGDGYNGGGIHVESGVEWDFSRSLSFRGGLQFASLYYHDPTGEGDRTAGFHPFTTRQLGAALRFAFYPDILP